MLRHRAVLWIQHHAVGIGREVKIIVVFPVFRLTVAVLPLVDIERSWPSVATVVPPAPEVTKADAVPVVSVNVSVEPLTATV